MPRARAVLPVLSARLSPRASISIGGSQPSPNSPAILLSLHIHMPFKLPKVAEVFKRNRHRGLDVRTTKRDEAPLARGLEFEDAHFRAQVDDRKTAQGFRSFSHLNQRSWESELLPRPPFSLLPWETWSDSNIHDALFSFTCMNGILDLDFSTRLLGLVM